MSLTETAKKWILGIALKKAVVSAAKFIASYAVAKGIGFSLTLNGTPINAQDEVGVAIALNSGLTVLRNWLKVKYPEKCGWL